MPSKLTTDQFIARAKASHGNRYGYHLTEYVNNLTPVRIVCPSHGEFLQRPAHHMNGHGCPSCKADMTSERCRDSQAGFIAKARAIHGDTYDYSRVRYVSSGRKVSILCRVHGEFEQTPNSHISRKAGCPKCAGKQMSTDDFIARASSIHSGVYGYARTEYRRIKDRVLITCPAHGDFSQAAEAHLIGHGCPQCWRESYSSRGEHDLAAFLAEHGVDFVRNTREAIGNGIEIDIYLPDRRIGIEYNGCYWHSDKANANIRIHEYKRTSASKNGIRIITVWDFDWTHRRAIVERMLLHAIGIPPESRVNARDCAVAIIQSNTASAFYEQHHIQGPCRGGIVNLALVHPDTGLVAVMTFTKGGARRGIVSDDEWELARFASSCLVRGGAGKLFAHFVRHYEASRIWSFSDDQHFSGDLYPRLGFAMDGRIRPDYRVVRPNHLSVWHKSLWQRRHIPARLRELGIDEPFDPDTDTRTEREMQDLARVLRVWDAGKTRWLWQRH